MGRNNNSGCVFSPSPALYRGSQEPACSVTASSYGEHQSERLLRVKLGRADCSLVPLLQFPWLSDFSNTAHQDQHHARGWGAIPGLWLQGVGAITALWCSWWHSSLGEPHIPLHCRLPGQSFHGHVISCISECPHHHFLELCTINITHLLVTVIFYKSHPALSWCHFQLNHLVFFSFIFIFSNRLSGMTCLTLSSTSTPWSWNSYFCDPYSTALSGTRSKERKLGWPSQHSDKEETHRILPIIA